jgi:hypothetical protein
VRIHRATVVTLGVSLIVSVAGCAAEQTTKATPVGSVELEKSLTDKLIQAGTPPSGVTCDKELPEQSGRTVRCEVQFAPENAVTAVLRTTGGELGGYEIAGAELSREQLAARVGGLVPGQAVVCESGIKGDIGSWTRCDLTANGATSVQIAEVRAISGLTMDLAVTPSLPKEQVQERLLGGLAEFGLRPESAECGQDLLGVMGTTLNCVVAVDDKRVTYIVTVTGVDGGQINFDYQRKVPNQGR